jgi:hypothetical protein
MRELAPAERGVLRLIIDQLPDPQRSQLLRQLEHTVVRGGPVTMLELGVAAELVPMDQLSDPLPVRVLHQNPAGDMLGEVLVWTTDGYLSHLEYAWVTDEPPSEIPPPMEFRITP